MASHDRCRKGSGTWGLIGGYNNLVHFYLTKEARGTSRGKEMLFSSIQLSSYS